MGRDGIEQIHTRSVMVACGLHQFLAEHCGQESSPDQVKSWTQCGPGLIDARWFVNYCGHSMKPRTSAKALQTSGTQAALGLSFGFSSRLLPFFTRITWPLRSAQRCESKLGGF